MRVLYIATSFPEPKKGATIYTDLAEHLRDAGHHVSVAVSEQAKNNAETNLKKERGIDVLRVVTGNYYDVGLLEKGITTIKLPFLMRRGIIKYFGGKSFDMILFESPPVTNASLINWAKKKFKCPSYLMLKDIFPQNAVDIGIIQENSLLYRYFKIQERKLYQTADYIGCMSPANKRYIVQNNPWLDCAKVELFPNTKKIANNYKPQSYEMRRRYKIPTDACVFLFGGNMGRPQYIELLCNTVRRMKEKSDVFFLFVGRGTDRSKIEETISKNNIKNALLLENLPRDEYEQLTKECDVGLIVLDPRFTIPNYPSRILSYMEYAKPVLAVTDKVSDLRDLIETANCGLWVWSGNEDAFIKKVSEIAESDQLADLGENGRNYMLENLQVEHSVRISERHFE